MTAFINALERIAHSHLVGNQDEESTGEKYRTQNTSDHALHLEPRREYSAAVTTGGSRISMQGRKHSSEILVNILLLSSSWLYSFLQ